MMSTHVETELLAYLDKELDVQERARVEAHLAECPRCAAELERLQTLQQQLGATFDAALTPVRLPAAADTRIRKRLRTRTEPRPWAWAWLWRQRGLAAQALMAVLVLFFTLNTAQVLRLPTTAAPHRTLVFGQDKLAPGSKAALRVIVRETAAEAEPIEGAEVVVRIGRTPGLASIVYTGYTDANGTAEITFNVPGDMGGEASLVIETASAGGADQIVRSITIERDYKLFLNSDKPSYSPGQTIHARALAFEAIDLKPAADQRVTFTLLDPSLDPLTAPSPDTVAASDFGIAALDYVLPPDAEHGEYTLRAELGDTRSERTVTVGTHDLPDFRVTLETQDTFYTPGERVEGFVQAAYFFGKPVTGGQVTLHGYTGGPERLRAVQILGQTDAEGRFEFAFDLPASYGLSALDEPVGFDVEVDILDTGGQREAIRRILPIAAHPILISAIPESGKLKPGIENTIFILTSYPDGRPAETMLVIQADDEKHALTTGPYGLAEFHYTPAGTTTWFGISAQDAQGAEGIATLDFANDRAPRALLLRAERAAYEVGDTLRPEALVAGMEDAAAQTVYLDVVRAEQTIATFSSSARDGRAVFALDLDGTMAGTLELHAYTILPDGSVVGDTRLVIVDTPRQVVVAVSADQDQYRPGETAHLHFQTALTSTGQSEMQPVQSALGIGVVDESVYALEELSPGFVRAYFLLEQELLELQVRGLDVPALLDAEAEAKMAQDMAARAAWAGARGTDVTLAAKSTAEQPEEAAARIALTVNRLGLLLSLLPLLLSTAVVQGLGPTGVRSHALRRVGIGSLLLLIGSPVVAFVGGGAMWLLWTALGAGAPTAVLLAVAALLIGLTVYGWRRRDTRVQLATGLLAAYLVLGGGLVILAARDGGPHGALLALIAATFLLTVAALATLGQGLVIEGWRGAGWATTLMALLLIPLAVYLPFVPGLASDLTRTLGHPALYAGPAGWLTGCSAPQAEQVVVTRVVEKEGETVVEEVIVTATPEPLPTQAPATEAPPQEPTEEPPAEAPTVTPTVAPAATPTATPEPIPSEPFPLRQVFPETLYWNAESITDENGNLTLDLPLADTITTWRLTALASTQEGELGVTTYDILVFQDFFVELDLPAAIGQGETVAANITLYNYLPEAQAIQLDPVPADWYSLVTPPQAVTLPPNGTATVTFTIRAEQTGDFSLQVVATGEHTSDAVAADVAVE